jgi:hypothetical protein
MNRTIFIVVIFSFIIIASCSKNNDPASYSIVGTWKFASQNNISFSYPSVLTNPTPIGTSNFTYPTDSIKAIFNINGNFSFSNFRLPISYGTYKVIRDTLVVITPDTSGLIQFCYNVPFIGGGTWIPGTPLPPTPLPYSNFQFTSDTIIFKNYNNKDLVFTAYRLTKTITPNLPSGDTLLLNKITSNFVNR